MSAGWENGSIEPNDSEEPMNTNDSPFETDHERTLRILDGMKRAHELALQAMREGEEELARRQMARTEADEAGRLPPLPTNHLFCGWAVRWDGGDRFTPFSGCRFCGGFVNGWSRP